MRTIYLIILSLLLSTTYAATKVELDVEGKKCYAQYQDNQLEQSYGGLVIVSRGVNPAAKFLQKGLAKYGYGTIIIKLTKECPPTQIASAIRYLRQQKFKRIIALYYGKGVTPFLDFLIKPKAKKISGIALVSAFDLRKDNSSEKIDYNQWKIPTFDIVGQLDYLPVLKQWQLRRDSIKDKDYVALNIPGAEHDYADSQQVLINWLAGWMKKQKEDEVKKSPLKEKKR